MTLSIKSGVATTLLATLTLALVSFSSFADYQLLAKDSQLNFVSVKKDSIGELHSFKSIDGDIDANGLATVNIDLSSVETGIEIRNERMKSMLFDVKQFSTATIETQVSLEALEKLKVGESFHRHVPVSVSLHGKTQSLTAHSDVVKIADNKIAVYSTKPVLVDAAQFDLVNGIMALQKIAGLPSIATSVPVTFKLVFEQQ